MIDNNRLINIFITKNTYKLYKSGTETGFSKTGFKPLSDDSYKPITESKLTQCENRYYNQIQNRSF